MSLSSLALKKRIPCDSRRRISSEHEHEPVSIASVSRAWGGSGQGEALRQRRWMAVETEADTVWEKQLSGAAPAIHLTSDQARHEWHCCFTFCILFIHLRGAFTHLKTLTHKTMPTREPAPIVDIYTFKYTQSEPRLSSAFISPLLFLIYCL